MRLNAPRRKMTSRSHCEAMCTVKIAIVAKASPMHRTQIFIAPAIKYPITATSANTMMNVNAENTFAALSFTCLVLGEFKNSISAERAFTACAAAFFVLLLRNPIVTLLLFCFAGLALHIVDD